jgi:hypothetical protein
MIRQFATISAITASFVPSLARKIQAEVGVRKMIGMGTLRKGRAPGQHGHGKPGPKNLRMVGILAS